ncbi:hypothetical protein Taro_009631 [Colocasia esculenta]|uniref:Uncharacterized protein n=1 Tax=Colocasia esculenta TaxID=4460 RepID=A0A843U4K0_COLES|nr:hypothetical protein [Colocasia esculenta]
MRMVGRTSAMAQITKKSTTDLQELGVYTNLSQWCLHSPPVCRHWLTVPEACSERSNQWCRHSPPVYTNLSQWCRHSPHVCRHWLTVPEACSDRSNQWCRHSPPVCQH